MAVTKEKETKYVTMTVDGDVLKMVYKPLTLSIEVAKEIVKDRLDWVEGKWYLCLFDIRSMITSDKEGRDYMANEGSAQVTASSLLVSSSVTKMMGNFFMTVSKPKTPTRLFTDESEAMEWLSSQASMVH